MITIKHNFDSNKFKWLWSKYVVNGNDEKHCTASLKGRYSKKFSKHNENFNNETTMSFDEYEEGTYKAIYICGVISKGYSQKKNYPHNIHAAIIPKLGARDIWEFEGWKIEVENGVFDKIPEIEELPQKYRELPAEYVTCRIFRWAIGFFYNKSLESICEEPDRIPLDDPDLSFEEMIWHQINDNYEQCSQWEQDKEFVKMVEDKNNMLVEEFRRTGDEDKLFEDMKEFVWGIEDRML